MFLRPVPDCSSIGTPVRSSAPLSSEIASLEQLPSQRRAVGVDLSENSIDLALRVRSSRFEREAKPTQEDIPLRALRGNPRHPPIDEKGVEDLPFPLRPPLPHVDIVPNDEVRGDILARARTLRTPSDPIDQRSSALSIWSRI